jgi:hypothetical protein
MRISLMEYFKNNPNARYQVKELIEKIENNEQR